MTELKGEPVHPSQQTNRMSWLGMTLSTSFMIVFSGTVLQILLQFALSVLLARFFGSSVEFDAYTIALMIPLAISALLAGAITTPFITFLNRAATSEARKELAGTVLQTALIASFLVAVLGWWLREPIIHLGFQGGSEDLKELAVRLFAVTVWLIPANVAIGLVQAILQQTLEFRIPAVAGVSGPLVTVLIVGTVASHYGILAVAVATLLGAVVNVLVQLPLLMQRIAWPIRASLLRPMAAMSWAGLPVFVGFLVVKADTIVDPMVASAMEQGAISHLRYATQMVLIFITLGTGTLSTLAFPRLALSAATDRTQFMQEIASSVRTLIMLLMPSVFVIVLFGGPLVTDLFQRGEFHSSDTVSVAMLMALLSGYLIGAGVSEICVKVFASDHDTWTPNLLTCLCVGAGIAVKFLFGRQLGIHGLAATTSVTFLVLSASLILLVANRYGKRSFDGAMSTVVKSGCASAIAALAGSLLLALDFPFNAIVGLSVGGLCYAGIMILWSPELRHLLFSQRR